MNINKVHILSQMKGWTLLPCDASWSAVLIWNFWFVWEYCYCYWFICACAKLLWIFCHTVKHNNNESEQQLFPTWSYIRGAKAIPSAEITMPVTKTMQSSSALCRRVVQRFCRSPSSNVTRATVSLQWTIAQYILHKRGTRIPLTDTETWHTWPRYVTIIHDKSHRN